jgi:tetratricopeptide (TPR) repeat protein/anti-sigma regulatory factor (Ser/Thr protein kinase)
LARICFNLIGTDPDSALLVGEQALALAARIGHPKALGDAHNNLGWLAVGQGQFDRADSLLHIALGIFQRIGDPAYTAVTLGNLGWLAEKRGDQVGAVTRFQAALRQSEAANDSASAAVALYSIGATYRRMKEFGPALENLERARLLEQALRRPTNEARCLQAIANVHTDQGDHASALPYYTEAFRTYRAHGDLVAAGVVQENIGDMYAAHRPKTALGHYATALAYYDSAGSRADQAFVHHRIGSALASLHRYPDAKASYERSMDLARATGSTGLLMDLELNMAELEVKQGNSDGAIGHYQRHMALKDSLQGAEVQRELARLRTEFDTERKEKDNALLRAQNSEQQERIQRREVQLYGSIALGLLALAGAGLVFRNYRQKRRHAEALETLNDQLAASNAEIKEINGLLEMKLLRSQMNPHFIYNCLNSAARMTQAGRQAEALAYLQGFARLLRMVLDHSVDDTVGIQQEVDFLRQYLKLEAARLDDLRYEVNVDRQLLDADAEIPALLVQPFVENAVLHGLSGQPGEKRVRVDFSGTPDAVICTIEDNGVGRGHVTVATDEKGHRSLGMQLTSERLRLLTRRMTDAGAIRIEDLRDTDGRATGTRVTVLLH